MAGDWIKIEENMPEKPEVAIIADILGIPDPDTVAGKLVRVWAWATRNCNGDGVTSVTARKHLDRCAGVSGFSDAMQKAGWLTVDGDILAFPNFGRHCSQTAKERALTQKRVAKHRKKSGNGNGVTKALPEKRREEKREDADASSRAPSAAAALRHENSGDLPHNPNRSATFEQVVSFAKSQPMAITDECCEKFFDRMEADGWVNKFGFPLADWRPRFREWATSWSKNANNKNR